MKSADVKAAGADDKYVDVAWWLKRRRHWRHPGNDVGRGPGEEWEEGQEGGRSGKGVLCAWSPEGLLVRAAALHQGHDQGSSYHVIHEDE